MINAQMIPTKLMHKYWKSQQGAGRPIKPFWAVVSLGGELPKGFVKGWSISKCWINKRLRNEGHPENWMIVRIMPGHSLK